MTRLSGLTRPHSQAHKHIGLSVSRIINGKIVEEWVEWDAPGMMQQLGVASAAKATAMADV